MSKSFDESLPAHILFGDVIDPEFKEAMCKVINRYHLPDSKSMAVNIETNAWKLLEPGDEVPEGMTPIPPFHQMIKAYPTVCFYSISSIIKAIKILNPSVIAEGAIPEEKQIVTQPVNIRKTRNPRAKRKK